MSALSDHGRLRSFCCECPVKMKPSPVVEILNYAARALWRPQADLNAERRMVAVLKIDFVHGQFIN